MKKIVLSLIAFTMTSVSAIAGGILTNTNQSVLFLKNPARDAAIGLDGVYSNPAGVAFMADGLGSFESVVGTIAKKLEPLGAQGYDMDGYMKGRQYYYGIQLGAAYKVNSNLSVYGGLRLLYGDATYKAKISNILVKTAGGYVEFGDFMQGAIGYVDGKLDQVNAAIATYGETAELVAQKAQLEGTKTELGTLQKYAEGVNLLSNQDGMGVAPVIGVDWKYKNFNFAAKYEFKTQIRMKNESTVNKASEIAAVNKFRDAEKVNEDAPALLTIGAQWKPINEVSLNLGWHHYFDKDANWYNNTQDLLRRNTNEYLAGVEWDITDKLNVSGGAQLTRYGLTDEYMNDMSFVVNSYSFGFGFSYKVKDNITLSAAYFQTNYDKYTRENYFTVGVSDTFTRTNRVLGLGCQLDF